MKQKISVTVSRYTRLVNALLYDNEIIEFEIDHEEDVSELSDDELMTILNDRDLLWSTSWNVVRDKAVEDDDIFKVVACTSDFEYEDEESIDSYSEMLELSTEQLKEEESQSAAKDESIRYSSELLEVKAAPTELNLERIVSTVEDVTFYERVLPAPPDGEAFIIMETQVTQELYRAVTGQSPSKLEGDKLPVECVSWEDGITFCNALSEKLGLTPAYLGTDNKCELVVGANGFRLPFEAEWEFAARGGQNFKYAGSDNLKEVGWFGDKAWRTHPTHPVAQLKANGYGLYDMSGNVGEWCADDIKTEVSLRAYRGGGSWDYTCEVSKHSICKPGHCREYIGLRLSRSLGALLHR